MAVTAPEPPLTDGPLFRALRAAGVPSDLALEAAEEVRREAGSSAVEVIEGRRPPSGAGAQHPRPAMTFALERSPPSSGALFYALLQAGVDGGLAHEASEELRTHAGRNILAAAKARCAAKE